MSQRNPMNDRYQTDERKGQTRKSAASAKPKSKAASSVRIQSTTKTPQQKKAAKKAARQKSYELDRKYRNPPHEEYKKWRRVWWVLLVGAIILTGFALLVRNYAPEQEAFSLILLGFGYVGLLGALIIEFTKVRNIRKAYQAEMEGKTSKEERALEKKKHAAEVAARKEKEAAAGEGEAEKASSSSEKTQRKKGLFSFSNLSDSAKRASKANKEAARKQGAVEKKDEPSSEEGKDS